MPSSHVLVAYFPRCSLSILRKCDANVTSHSIFRADLDVDNAHVVLWNFNKCVYRPVDFKGQWVVVGSVVLVVVVVVEWAYMLLAMDPETKRY